jgi:protein TonB
MFTGIDAVTVIPRRRWTAVASFSLQAAVVAGALVLPLWRPMDLPQVFSPHRIFVPPSQPESPVTPTNPHPQTGPAGTGISFRPLVVNPDNGVHFGTARPIGSSIDTPPDPFGPSGPGGGRRPHFGIGTGTSVRPVLAKPPIVSVMMQGNLIHQIEPVYPSIAKAAGVQGTVLIKALISPNGRIEQAEVVSGSPLLSQAALEAIRQWKYRPYVLNGSPVEVETEITVNFVLSR